MLLFAVYLLTVVALPIALSMIVGFRSLPHGAACPNCAQKTFLLVSPALRSLARLPVAGTLQRRWCPACDWDGYARALAPDSRLVVISATRMRRRQQLRTLELGGRSWRVMLESWREQNCYFGRLVFVGPSGKLWNDPQPSFSAPTHAEILAQAVSVSDRLLTYRLRDVVSG